MTLLAALGLLLMSLCRNVQTYAAAQVGVPSKSLKSSVLTFAAGHISSWN